MKKMVCLLVVLIALCMSVSALAGAQLYPGATVRFGTYEQDGNLQNGPEDIEWTVVSCDQEAVVLISKYGLDCMPYHSFDGDILWEESTLRYWLNAVFYNQAFSQSEQQFMLTGVLANPENPKFGTYGGDLTQDNVFVPSAVDVEWNSSFSMKAKPTRYAVQRGVHQNKDGYCWWWLRTPGKNYERVTHVTYEGKVYSEGTAPTTSSGAVRPCIFLNAQMLR